MLDSYVKYKPRQLPARELCTFAQSGRDLQNCRMAHREGETKTGDTPSVTSPEHCLQLPELLEVIYMIVLSFSLRVSVYTCVNICVCVCVCMESFSQNLSLLSWVATRPVTVAGMARTLNTARELFANGCLSLRCPRFKSHQHGSRKAHECIREREEVSEVRRLLPQRTRVSLCHGPCGAPYVLEKRDTPLMCSGRSL